MAKNTLEILITANARQAQATLTALDKTVGKFGASSGKGIDTLKAKWKALDATMSSPAGMKAMIGTAGAVVGALVGIGVGVKKLADDYMNYAFQVKDFGRIIGATPQEASKLIQVADDVRLSVESMTMAMKGAITKGYEPTIAGLGRMSDAYLAIDSPIAKSKFLIDTFGRSGLEMAKLMELGSEKITLMGDSIEGTSRLMTAQGVQAATAYYTALDKLGESGENLTLTLGKKTIPVVTSLADTMTLMAGNIENNALPAIWKLIQAMGYFEISMVDGFRAIGQYLSGARDMSAITDLLVTKQTTLDQSLESVRIGMTGVIGPTQDLAEDTAELTGNTDKAAASMSEFAGAVKRVPNKISIGFDFKLPDIVGELEALVKGDQWRTAGGAAIESFWSGVRGGVSGLSGESLQAAASKIGALELAAKVEIGEISTAEAIKSLQDAFGGTGGEAAATINAALAIDPNSETEIKAYLQTVLTEPTSFTVTPSVDPATLEELRAAMAGPYNATITAGLDDANKAELIEKIKGMVKGSEIPIELIVKLKEMNKAELAGIAAQLAPKPVEITMKPLVDQAALDFLYKNDLSRPAYPVMTPRVNQSALEAARAILAAPVMVPLIAVPTGGGSPWPVPGGTNPALGTTAVGKRELQTGLDLNGNKIIGAKYGLDMIIPPGYSNDRFPIMTSSGERVQVTRPGEKSGSTTIINNFSIVSQPGWNVRELARQVTREQQRAGVK